MSKVIGLALVVVVVALVAYSQADEKTKSADSSTTATTAKTSDGLAASAASGAKEEDAKQDKSDAPAKGAKQDKDPEKIDWKKVDWRKRLTELQYHITREAGTERPFKNEYWDHFKEGQYKCVGCGLPLFESDSKFDAHCGWPSFDKTVAKDSVTEHIDRKLYYPRKEIRCRRCGAHLGHVFDDGPTKTKLRYCMNSAAMKFVPAKGAVKKDGEKSKVAPTEGTKDAEPAATDAAK